MKQEQLQSMRKAWWISKRGGFSLVEAVLAVSIFGMLVSILVGALLYGQDSTRVVGQREEATFLAEEALEAVRNIRDADYTSLSTGTYGLDTSSGEWELSGSEETIGDYTRTITISSVDTSRKLILAEVSWEEPGRGTQRVTLRSYMTNWQESVPVEDCDSTCTAAGYDSGSCRADSTACSDNSESYLSSGDTYCTVESITACCCVGGVDETAPTAISDLAVSSVASSSVDLTWTAPGDDGSSGTATTYDIRYSTSLIDSSNWSSATQLAGEPTPSAASSTESVTVASLSSELTYYFAIKTSDEVPNESDLSNVVATTTLPGPDEVAPAAVTDLTLSNETDSSIDLGWTAPGDDGDTGTATSYDIRYSTELITEDNWASATEISGEPTPAEAGTSESVTVSGLSEDVTYYFAMKTTDDEGNVSDISNVPSTSTAVVVDTCAEYCQSIDYSMGGACWTTPEQGFGRDYVWETGGDDYCIVESYECCCGPIEDVIAPSAITDMSYNTLDAATFNLAFTAPGDNGDYGTVSSYQMRYSTTSPLTEETWSTFYHLGTISTASTSFVAGGETQTLAVSAAHWDTTIYVSLRAYDEVGNASSISNNVTLTTGSLNISKVICTEAYQQGYLEEDLYQADADYAEKYANAYILRGYHAWGKPVVRIIQHNTKLLKRVFPFTREWSEHSAYALGKRDEDSPIGKMLIETAFPLCEELGQMMAEDGQYDYQFDDYKVEAAMEEYYQDYYNMGLSDEELVPIVKKDFEMFMALAKEVYLEDRANGFVDEREVYDDVWFVKLFKFIRETYNDVVDKLHE